MEEGADIAVSARLENDMVRITVADTGPGQNTPVRKTSDSTGVGLGNIQERLNQAYGEAHQFEIQSSPGGGFSVIIALPFETREQIDKDAAADTSSDDQVRNESIFGEHASDGHHDEALVTAPAMVPSHQKDISP